MCEKNLSVVVENCKQRQCKNLKFEENDKIVKIEDTTYIIISCLVPPIFQRSQKIGF